MVMTKMNDSNTNAVAYYQSTLHDFNKNFLQKKQFKRYNSFRFIDLFCGIGGIRLGMKRAGFDCVFSCDINDECKKTYNANFNELPHGDIVHIHEDDIPDFEILCAGFPCQPFNISEKQKGFEDIRGTLFFEICRIIKSKQPPIVFLENVKHLIHHGGGRTLKIILEQLQEFGYAVEWKLLNALDYGVPQNRERIIIIASKESAFNFDTLVKSKRRVLIDALDTCGNFEFLEEQDYTLIENPIIQKNRVCFCRIQK
jgi:DNA (cytosine-5)-methyltransferase 1